MEKNNKDTYNNGYLAALNAVISVCNQEIKFDEDNLSKVHGDIIGKSFIKGVKQVRTMVEKMIELVEEE